MRRNSWLPALLLSACVLSCSNDNNDPAPTVDREAPTTGTWRVALFKGDASGGIFDL